MTNRSLCSAVTVVVLLAGSVTLGCGLSAQPERDRYQEAFRRGAYVHLSDPVQFHDPHGLMTLGLLRPQLNAEFGAEQVESWLTRAVAEACLIETSSGWAGAHVLQPDLPAVPSCGEVPSNHFTSELIFALSFNDLPAFERDGWGDEQLVVTRASLVQYLQQHSALDLWSPGMETQALIMGGVSLTDSWQDVDGQPWTITALLDAAVQQWRTNRDAANLQPGDLVPENMLHLAPAVLALAERDPVAAQSYLPVLQEVFDTYRQALHPDGYWGFAGEASSTGHMVEQFIKAHQAGLASDLPSLRPVEHMVEHQDADGWFDIHNELFIGAQGHGVRALGFTLERLKAQASSGS